MKTIVVLGMHRSATSLVAKALSNEIYWGKPDQLIGPGPGNPLGHFEHADFMNLNAAILSKAQFFGEGSIDPNARDYLTPRREAILAFRDEFAPKMKALVKRMTEEATEAGYALWGWKDPRNSLTAELWHPYLENPHYIVCFRESDKVAASLYQRDRTNGRSERQCRRLCDEYNERIFDFMMRFVYREQVVDA